jgi:hypothetical protein
MLMREVVSRHAGLFNGDAKYGLMPATGPTGKPLPAGLGL